MYINYSLKKMLQPTFRKIFFLVKPAFKCELFTIYYSFILAQNNSSIVAVVVVLVVVVVEKSYVSSSCSCTSSNSSGSSSKNFLFYPTIDDMIFKLKALPDFWKSLNMPEDLHRG